MRKGGENMIRLFGYLFYQLYTLLPEGEKYLGKYYYYTGTLNNDSNRTIKYIKYNIYMLNSKGKIVQSEWSNWSGTLPPGASTSIDTMIDAVSGVERYRTVIDEISYK